MISTVDPEARHTRKSPEARRDGYRAHLVAEPGTGLITDEELTKAAGPDNSDAATAATFLANDTSDTSDTGQTGQTGETDDFGVGCGRVDSEDALRPSGSTTDPGPGQARAELADRVR